MRKLNKRRGSGFIQTNKDAGGIKGAFAGTIAKTGFGTFQQRFDESSMGQRFGGNRGAAAATAGLFHEYDEEVKRQKTLTSGRSNEELLRDLESGKGSEEYQAAIAGTIMSRDHRASHQKAMAIIKKRMADATEAGDTVGMRQMSGVQKQVAHDMKEKPFGAGDTTLAKLEEGTYGQDIERDENTGEVTAVNADRGADIYQETQQRIETKLSEEKLAHMNPDDTRIIYELARRGHLTPGQEQKLKQTILAARDGRYKGDIKPESTAMHDEILEYIDHKTPMSNNHKSSKILPDDYVPPTP